ncbi:unnamed protein product [Effrenium voratum]|nr:unnamed protein product [Effrenium voratum]
MSDRRVLRRSECLLGSAPLLRTQVEQSNQNCYTFNQHGALAAAKRPSLQRSLSGGLEPSAWAPASAVLSSPSLPSSRRTIAVDRGISIEAMVAARRAARRHTDPGRAVQLVFHGARKAPGNGTRRPSLIDLTLPPQLTTPSQAPAPAPAPAPARVARGSLAFNLPAPASGASPRPSEVSFTMPHMPEAGKDEKESPRMSRDTTLTPNTALDSLASSQGDSPRQVTPYSVVYDGVKPMCFDFDRWGRKIYHFFPNEDDPGMDEVSSSDDD